MKNGLNFIAIDFETATPKRASICEAVSYTHLEAKVEKPQQEVPKPELEEVVARSAWHR